MSNEELLELLTPKAVFELTKISVGTLNKWRSEKRANRARHRLPFVKLSDGKSGRVMYRRVDVLAFIESRMQGIAVEGKTGVRKSKATKRGSR